MQAIILAAGSSTRTWPLTVTMPKSLLKIANKSILEHNLEQLEGMIDEAILVVGFKAEMIKAAFGNKFKNITIRYVEQKDQLGTGHALLQAEKYAEERFIVLVGDDMFFREDLLKLKCRKFSTGLKLVAESQSHSRLQKISEHDQEPPGAVNSSKISPISDGRFLTNEKYALLAQEVEKPENFGSIEEEKGCLKRIVEKSASPPSKLANVGCYLLSKAIFSLLKQVKKSERNEYELTDAINELARKENLKAINSQYWIPIGYPWDLLKANEFLLSKIKKSEIEGDIEKNATIKGNVIVGKGAIIKNGAYIEGPVVIGENCVIGPNCYIRASTSIGDNCKIGNAVEIKNSIIYNNTHIAHLSYVGDSVIGENVNFGAGTKIANLRHDNSNIKSMVKGQLIDTGRRKLGAIIGNDVHIGINTSIYPGRKIWSGKTTLPGEIVKEDII
ncbi:NTP transferase domain-containing protein [Candidatus Woesearchaeota archaeon]|nr:NTP transferase domain-containing protein [Candidatus Woesearchaeota archaeon]